MRSTWTEQDELRLTIVMGLRKGLRLVRGARRAFTEDEEHRIAGAIAEHLALANYEVRRGQRHSSGGALGVNASPA